MKKYLPFICFECRTSFLRAHDLYRDKATCPHCSHQGIRYHPDVVLPDKSDEDQWQVLEFLKDHGFYYQPVYNDISLGGLMFVEYPQNMEEAEVFVEKYKKWAEIR